MRRGEEIRIRICEVDALYQSSVNGIKKEEEEHQIIVPLFCGPIIERRFPSYVGSHRTCGWKEADYDAVPARGVQ